ncbi:MAG: hypothetical protein JSV90_00160 [Methanobacteriota archaeon]|nr:MAG: hypothetical protein JSV90_00160 [Euryarchaeota archaeon]
MKIVPVITIEGRVPFQNSQAKKRLRAVAADLSKSYDSAYVVDVDGITKNKPQLDVAQRVCDEMPTLYEGGVRYSHNVIDMLITGADRAVVGTRTLATVSELRGAFKLSENITFKVDFRDGIVSSDPGISGRAISDLIAEVVEIGVQDIIVPLALAEEVSRLRPMKGFTLGVLAPESESARLEPLDVDYIISEDAGSRENHE